MTKEKNIERIAGKLADQFEIRKRDNGESFYCQKRGNFNGFVYKWIQEKVHAIHENELPNDSIYAAIVESLRAIEEDGLENSYLEGEIYTARMIDWTYNNFADEYLDRVLEENAPKSFTILLGMAQGYWLQDILDRVKREFFGA